jgi:hypothetical protein
VAGLHFADFSFDGGPSLQSQQRLSSVDTYQLDDERLRDRQTPHVGSPFGLIGEREKTEEMILTLSSLWSFEGG